MTKSKMEQAGALKEPLLNDDIEDIKKDVGAVLDAVKELTKTTAELASQIEKSRKAGKF